MKHFILLFSISLFSNCFAQQPNPDLFQTWYLESFFTDDGAETVTVSEINPSITPTITFNSDFTFTGIGACNTFSGTFELNTTDDFIITDFTSTEIACEFDAHTSFETEYYFFLEIVAWLSIQTFEDELRLFMSTPPFGSGVFTNNPLSTSNFEKPNVSIFPNPAESLLHIQTENTLIQKVELYHLNGKKAKSVLSNFEYIAISDLSAGLYIVKIYTENGVLNKKFAKQ